MVFGTRGASSCIDSLSFSTEEGDHDHAALALAMDQVGFESAKNSTSAETFPQPWDSSAVLQSKDADADFKPLSKGMMASDGTTVGKTRVYL